MADDEWQESEPLPAAPVARTPYNARVYRRNPGSFGAQGNSNDNNWREQSSSSHYRHRISDGHRKVICVPSPKVGRIIGKGGSKIRELEYESEAKVWIGKSNGKETDVTLYGSIDAISKVEVMIQELLVDFKPRDRPRQSGAHNFGDSRQQQQAASSSNEPKLNKRNEDGMEVADSENAHNDQHEREIFANLPPIIKDFYVENTQVATMTPEEVRQWRLANNGIQVKRAFNDKPGLRPIPNPVITFEQAFQRYPEMLQEIYKQEFRQPSPIESQAWPILLRGEDLIGIAQTGTEKTLAFLLPALIHIEGQTIPREDRKGPTVLILVPTRENALQIDKEVSKYQYKNIKSVCLYGGGDRNEQIKTVAKGVDIVIATPGRLNDLVLARHLNVINFSYIVLDEADRMLDMGFGPQITKSLLDVRPDRQTVMTSATWPSGVRRLAESYMKDPIQINVGSVDLAPVHLVIQKLIFIEEDNKDETLFEFIRTMDPCDKILIFCDEKATASRIFSELACKGIPAQALHGDRDQSDHEAAALEHIVDSTVNILVATDVATRGIDIKGLTHVINLDFPRHIEEYVHRVSRTGRAGKTGIAMSFITRSDWAYARDLIKILEEADQEVPDELKQMAQRFEAMKIRRDQEGGRGRGGRGAIGGSARFRNNSGFYY